MKRSERCENCKHWKQDDYFPQDHVCCNDKSVCAADWTEAKDWCVDYERKEGKNEISK